MQSCCCALAVHAWKQEFIQGSMMHFFFLLQPLSDSHQTLEKKETTARHHGQTHAGDAAETHSIIEERLQFAAMTMQENQKLFFFDFSSLVPCF
jgi:hypothetical protein